MLVFAVAIVAFAFLNAGYGLANRVPSQLVPYLLVYIVMMAGAHLAVRRWAPYADPLLLPLAALLNGLGIVMIYRLAAQGNLLSAPMTMSDK